MSLLEHYTDLYKASSEQILAGNYVTDPLLDATSDSRFGLTLLLRPDAQTKRHFQDFLQQLKAIEPSQYYYPDSDIHVTVMSVISCYSGFDLAKIQVNEYVQLIQKSLERITNIGIGFRGVTASTSAVMVQGFPADNSLDDLRNNLRHNFRNSGLEESIDKRYTITTAHATVMRFRKELQNAAKLIELLNLYRNHTFGEFKVDRIELVYNDWYQREKSVKLLHTFQLK